MIRVLIAPDSFKGTMSAATVADAIAAGVRAAGAVAVPCPLADGGEGTVDVLARHLDGERIEISATGPLGDPVPAGFFLTSDGRTAVVDTATAGGLDLVPPARRDAEAATSPGPGRRGRRRADPARRRPPPLTQPDPA